jgi:hypothetical protein
VGCRCGGVGGKWQSNRGRDVHRPPNSTPFGFVSVRVLAYQTRALSFSPSCRLPHPSPPATILAVFTTLPTRRSARAPAPRPEQPRAAPWSCPPKERTPQAPQTPRVQRHSLQAQRRQPASILLGLPTIYAKSASPAPRARRRSAHPLNPPEGHRLSPNS